MGEMTGKGLTRIVMLNNTVYEVNASCGKSDPCNRCVK